MRPKILGIAGSLRNRAPDKLAEYIKNLKNHQEFMEFIEITSRDKSLSNSEAYLSCALFGAKDLVDIEYLSLAKHFPRTGEIKYVDELLEKINKVDGILLSTPVYFGDRSSLIQDLFDVLRKSDLDLSKKVLGCCSVGAKRNGGQETAIVYTLLDALERGFIITGNGPSTAQYGGTGVAGDVGAMREDFSGIETSISTGRKVAQTIQILKEGKKQLKKKDVIPKIGFFILSDKNNILQDNIKELLKKVNTSNVKTEILDLTKFKFNKCNACHVCPGNKNEELEYRCIYNDDDMIKLHDKILSFDAILSCSFAPKNTNGMDTTYQKFLERTRYFRRDNFKLTNRLIAGYGIEEVGANNLFSMRVFTSLIRQNTITHRPISQTYYKEKILEDEKDLINRLKSFFKYAKIIKAGRTNVDIGKIKCPSVGYGDHKVV